MRAVRLLRSAVELDGERVIDCAVGLGKHTQAFICYGKSVIGVDIGPPRITHERYTHIQKPFELLDLEPADIVWSCHTLEHVNNPGFMLKKFRDWLKPGGWLALSVPCSLQEKLHVGHLTLWTPAHLMYNLVVNGWDCRKAMWYTEYRSIAVLLQKTEDIDLSDRTAMPSEIDWLNRYLPLEIQHESNAWWPNNWPEETEPKAANPTNEVI